MRITTGPGPCLGPDLRSAGAQRHLIETMHIAETDTAMASWVARVGLVVVDSSQIQLVTDSGTCRRGLNALIAADTSTHQAPTAAYVLKAGPRYTVTDSHSAGEFSGVHWVFDTTFTIQKGRYLY